MYAKEYNNICGYNLFTCFYIEYVPTPLFYLVIKLIRCKRERDTGVIASLTEEGDRLIIWWVKYNDSN